MKNSEKNLENLIKAYNNTEKLTQCDLDGFNTIQEIDKFE